jgi:nitrous oxide reductase accessory protein NosL
MWRALAAVLIVTRVNAGCRHPKTTTPPIDVARSEEAGERFYFEGLPVT